MGIVWTAHENSRPTSGCITFSGILHHEMGHLFLHAHLDVSMVRTHESYPAYESSEWQANAFAGQLLMPHDTIVDMEIWKIADRFMVSESAAEKQKHVDITIATTSSRVAIGREARMAMHRIEKLRGNYEYLAARRVAFEDMCTLVFCEYLGLPGAVNMRVNQRGVEADPVEAVDPKTGTKEWFVYQVKHLDDGTELRDRASEFRASIDEARKLGADVLMLFVNKDLLDTDREKAFEDGLEAYAKDGQGRPAVRLDWWTLSRLEKALAQPRYSHIPDRFLGSNIGTFYRAVRERFYGDEGGELYGDVLLSVCYIEPTVDVKGYDGAYLTAREWIESFVNGKGKVAVLCGEPGHGKTSLCRKAACDFYEGGWLAHKVHNVFCFSLNPTYTSAIGRDGSLDIYSLFSWGLRRNNLLDPEQCRGALVFLDGFDELLEWKPGLDLKVFIRDYVSRFQRETGARVVVTTRSMVVEPDASYLQIGAYDSTPVVSLQLISKSQQVGWIGNTWSVCARSSRSVLSCHRGANGPDLVMSLPSLRLTPRNAASWTMAQIFRMSWGSPSSFVWWLQRVTCQNATSPYRVYTTISSTPHGCGMTTSPPVYRLLEAFFLEPSLDSILSISLALTGISQLLAVAPIYRQQCNRGGPFPRYPLVHYKNTAHDLLLNREFARGEQRSLPQEHDAFALKLADHLASAG